MTAAEMSGVLRAILIMSLSGGALALLLFALKPLIRHRLPKQVQYCLWLVALVTLLVPLSKLIVLPKAPANADIAVAPISAVVERSFTSLEAVSIQPPAHGAAAASGTDLPPASSGTDQAVQPATAAQNPGPGLIAVLLMAYAGIVSLVLLYQIACYLNFIGKMRRGRIPARPAELAMLAGLRRGKRAPRLTRGATAVTPMLIGVFRPVIVLPDRDYGENQLRGILLHELTHLRRRDVAVKWLSALACALHFFNPIVWLARREIDRACELSCDEAVIRGLDRSGRRSYGDTLLSVAASSAAPRAVLSTTMCEEKKNLKERLLAIMRHKKAGRVSALVSGVILLAAVCAACALGAGINPLGDKTDAKLPVPLSAQAPISTDNSAARAPASSPTPSPTAQPLTGRRPDCYTFLLAGVDPTTGNTDTIMAGTLDAREHKLSFVSIPRDTLVDVPWAVKKLGAVYSAPNGITAGDQTLKGIDALNYEVSLLTGFPIDSYFVVNVQGLEKLVDAIGGVTFDVPQDMYYRDPSQNLTISLKAGAQLLDGKKAMELLRFRTYPEGDLRRIQVQQAFLKAALSQMLQLGNIGKVNDWLQIFKENVDTDLTTGNLLWYAQQFLNLKSDDIAFQSVPTGNCSINGVSYVSVDPDAWLAALNGALNPNYEDITAADLDIFQYAG